MFWKGGLCLNISLNLFCSTGTFKPWRTCTYHSSRNNRHSHPAMVAEREICVSMCISSQCNHYTPFFLYLFTVHWNISWRLIKAQKKRSLLISQEYTSCRGSQTQTASCNSTFWVIFSSCFADWNWLRYSITLKLAAVNFSCNAFTSGLSAFEEKNVLGKNTVLKENLKWLRSTDPSGSQNLLFPDPCLP